MSEPVAPEETKDGNGSATADGNANSNIDNRSSVDNSSTGSGSDGSAADTDVAAADSSADSSADGSANDSANDIVSSGANDSASANSNGGSDGNSAADNASSSTGSAAQGHKISRRHLLIGLLAIFIVVDIIIGIILVTQAMGHTAKPNPNPLDLVRSQVVNNHGNAIADIGYDPALSFATYGPSITTVDVSTLKPLDNNYLASVGKGSDAQPVLIDNTAVARVIAAYSDWSAYLNNNNTVVMAQSVVAGSQGEQYFTSQAGNQIAIYRLAIGEIRYSRPMFQPLTVYVLAQPSYTLLKDGISSPVSNVCLLKLVAQGSTLVISEIETLVPVQPNFGSSQPAPDQGSASQPDVGQMPDEVQPPADEQPPAEGQPTEGQPPAEDQPAPEQAPDWQQPDTSPDAGQQPGDGAVDGGGQEDIEGQVDPPQTSPEEHEVE